LLVLNLNIDSYGKEIANSCLNSFKKFTFESNKECNENLCGECCEFLEIEREIKFCKKQCGFDGSEEKFPPKSFLKQEKGESDSHVTNELEKMKHIKVVDLSKKKESEQNSKYSFLNSTMAFPPFLNASHFKDANFENFKLIDSLCFSRYFKNCKESLCSDYCNDSPNIVNEKCFKDCTMFSNNKKENLYQYIIKRHAYYEARLDVIDDKKMNEDFGSQINHIELNTAQNTAHKDESEDERIKSLIGKSKEAIEALKRKLFHEEKILLGLYKMKKT